LVEPGNVKALAAGMIEMLRRHEEFDSQLIREHALNRFGSTQFLQTMKKIYSEI
jgi:hypothetical protein